MKTLNMLLGQDLSAYAYIEIPADTDLNQENLARIAQKSLEDTIFDADWSSVTALRVVSIADDDGNRLAEDIPLETSLFDAGQSLRTFLTNGNAEGGFKKVVEEAANHHLISPIEEIGYQGSFNLTGCESIELEFKARKGATQDELDIAFIQALAQVSAIAYRQAE